MVLMCQVGLLPGLSDLSPRSFAESWRATDRHMDKLMPPYKGSLLLFTLVTAVLLWLQHRPLLAACCAASLLMSIAGLVLTIRGQLPLNREIQAGTPPDSRLLEIRDQTVAGFRTRFFLAALSFVSLCIGVVFWPAA